MTDIQRARDVLAKWRKGSALGPWRFNTNGPRYVFSAEPFNEVADLTNGSADSALIVGTAGNPDLLDGLDDLLGGTLAAMSLGEAPSAYTERIAAAIIAADERMSA